MRAHARDGAENAALLAPLQAGLEADHVVEAPLGVVLAELDHGVGDLTGPRVGEADGLHRAEA
jgi:hypothetical protein